MHQSPTLLSPKYDNGRNGKINKNKMLIESIYSSLKSKMNTSQKIILVFQEKWYLQ